ncbi:IS200/IS605 family element transposase accessory protein TnpB [Calothrix sp. FACHB-1219]|uniref:RNA-guided endonuclease InsQ/TnpB family protein n=1 Tax=unclassified Calothrix TaxID=2619626 RepID=UPI001688D59E|nr:MULTISPECIES: RNA-guided endonuclease TnpB family protein [unclassified Calothrix]MBD2203813.1 IS200/IS605 family element transposase accessory protein TnpB [Calothrix sp. FACHB-168]MBD2219631.1 IS200/IS605 family element transposase accessory protein TnpB [Calothrix sp. FACHB-1219]
MLANYVYKLRPNTTQSSTMCSWVDILRSHYNWCLNDRLTQYAQQFIQGDYCDVRTKAEACPITCFVSKNGATGEPWKDDKKANPRRTAGDIQITALPTLKKARHWFASIDSTVLQQNVKRLDTAYKNFFEGRGFPKFKNRSNFTSFTYQMGIKIQKNKIYLPKVGWMRFYNSRQIPSSFTIKAATIRKRQDGWYVSIKIEDKTVPDYVARPLSDVQSIIGCDLGLTKLVHLSDGHQIENPKFLTNKKTKRILKNRQRQVSRKLKGSNNRKKAATNVGKFQKKIADKRQAYQWHIANKIVSRNVDAIAVENLNVSAMKKRCKPKIDARTGRFLENGQSRKRALNRSISDASWGELIFKIEYLAEKHGKVVIKVNPKHTSQKCQNCGHVDANNRDDEKFICTSCGFMSHADINAAKNIKDRALSMVRQCGLGVSPSRATAEPFRVRGDSAKPEPKGSKRPKKPKETSPRSMSKRGEPGNLISQDIKTVMS